jgi:hypothetical protein
MTKKIYQMTIEEINQFITELLPIKKFEKDNFGEVFTHPTLINKMLDLFPNHIWSEPLKKWLDPSVGTGFFMIFVYLRLMKGLEKWETNETKRSKHIIKNMLFMVELNKQNCNIIVNIFGAKVNLICGDFLTDSFKDSLSFDCIIGNPPFQDNYGLTSKGKRISGGKSKLYERIFLKSYDILMKDGYLAFIVPDNIFSGNGSECYKTLIKNFIPFVSFNPSNQTFFPDIQQPICYFLLKKNGKPDFTTIDNGENTFQIRLEDRPVNPIRDWTLDTEKLIKKYVSNERNNVIYNRGSSIDSYKGSSKLVKYPIVYTPSKIIYTNNSKLVIGYGIKKAIIFSISTDNAFKMDYSGEYGIGPNTFYIPFNTISQGKKLEKFLNSNDYKTMVYSTKTSRQYLKIALLEHLILTNIFASEKVFKKTYKNKKKDNKKNKKTRKQNK